MAEMYLKTLISNVMNELTTTAPLTKDSISSNPDLLKAYFFKIKELHTSGERFPVNFDEVWPLVYSRRDNAFTHLKETFYDGDDFNLLQNQKVVKINELQNGVKVDVYLTVACLEHFVARKVREVFEVYRQIFHQATTQMTQAQALLQSVQVLVNLEKRTIKIEKDVAGLMADRQLATQQLTVLPLSDEEMPELSEKDEVIKLVNNYSRMTGINQHNVWNSIYDRLLYAYHIKIKAYKKQKGESYLQVADREGHLGKIKTIISSFIKNFQSQLRIA